MIRRSVNILKTNSFFLLGPRGTGKTKLLEEMFPPSENLYIDLLNPEEVELFSLTPSELSRRIAARSHSTSWVVIDEIQKIPKLLDLVHRHIEKDGTLFALSGSSARKLKRGGANLLAGRAYSYPLYPFTFNELGNLFDLDDALAWGTLPKAALQNSDEERKLYLQSYVHTYLQEEIQSEQIVRKLDPFRKFLAVAAQSNGEIVNFAKIARDVGTTDTSVKKYFEILEDTLLGFFLPAYHPSIRKQQRETPKFFFFDTGVQRALSKSLDIPLRPQTFFFGKAFEHFIILEIFRQSSYLRNDFSFSYLKTTEQKEIDLIVERPGREPVLIEIKSTDRTTIEDVKNLIHFQKDFPKSKLLCLSRDPHHKLISGVEVSPWQEGIKKIFDPNYQ